MGSKYSSSKYFVFAGIIVDNSKKLDNLVKNTYRKFNKIKKMNELKGTTTPINVKKDILKRLNNIDYQVFIIIFDKRNKYKINYQNEVNILYDILASQLAKIIPIHERTYIFIDKSKNKNQIADFNRLFINNLVNLNLSGL